MARQYDSVERGQSRDLSRSGMRGSNASDNVVVFVVFSYRLVVCTYRPARLLRTTSTRDKIKAGPSQVTSTAFLCKSQQLECRLIKTSYAHMNLTFNIVDRT